MISSYLSYIYPTIWQKIEISLKIHFKCCPYIPIMGFVFLCKIQEHTVFGKDAITITSHECQGIWNHWQLSHLFNSLFSLTTIKTSKLCITELFVSEIHQWPMDSHHKGPVMWLSCHHVTSQKQRNNCPPISGHLPYLSGSCAETQMTYIGMVNQLINPLKNKQNGCHF